MTRRLAQLWRALPFLFKLQGLGVAAALVVAAGVANLGVHQGFERVAFALPAAEQTQMPWNSEVDAFGHKVAQAFGVRRSTATEFAGWILEASERQELEPELLASLVLTESSFRKDARSHVGAVGPAQVRPEYWSRFCGIANLHDPAENIYCGAQVLSHLKDRCGDEGCALEAYNVGIYGERAKAARRYVSKIDRYRDQLRNLPL
ncbi:MAG: transglycosylase SLT domain-containing protein [Gammaproteobacteria bacterium]|nr:transglycosylase SLT domain-containing protein [Gammaproteobacteria bacterium]